MFAWQDDVQWRGLRSSPNHSSSAVRKIIIACASGMLTVLAGLSPCSTTAADTSSESDAASVRKLMAGAQAGRAADQYEIGTRYLSGKGVPRNDSLAALWIQRAEQQGNLDAAFALASLYLNGTGVPRDPAEAAKRLRSAADRGHAASQFWMAASQYRDWQSSADPSQHKEFMRWAHASAEQGFPPAEFALGSVYRSGDGVPRDSAAAIRWLSEAARHHLPEAQQMLAKMLRGNEWKPAKPDEAAAWFREAAEVGNPDAQVALALLLSANHPITKGVFTLEKGESGGQDLVGAYAWLSIASRSGDEEAGALEKLLRPSLSKKQLAEAGRLASRWLEEHTGARGGEDEENAALIESYRKRAENGEAEAQLALGALYHEGAGVERDYREAARWTRLAADQGLAKAQAALGELYLRGEGLEQSDADAAKWYRKAAENGSPDGQEQLGILYSNGAGVPQDDRLALAWALKSAEQGLASGQYTAGFFLCCKVPSTVASDEVASYAWFTLAAEGGYEEAGQFLAMLEGTMKPEQLAEAKRRAAAWRERHPRRSDD